MTDSRSGRSSFDSKLISLLPLDDAPVHVHPFAPRAPCDSQGSECQCGIHRAEAASALRSRKTERAAKEKPTPISQIFFYHLLRLAPSPPLPPPPGAPVTAPPFAARAPCDSQGSECQCGIHRAEAASALRSRKTERAAKEKPTPISQIFF